MTLSDIHLSRTGFSSGRSTTSGQPPAVRNIKQAAPNADVYG